jgi:hypothetical protein
MKNFVEETDYGVDEIKYSNCWELVIPMIIINVTEIWLLVHWLG